MQYETLAAIILVGGILSTADAALAQPEMDLTISNNTETNLVLNRNTFRLTEEPNAAPKHLDKNDTRQITASANDSQMLHGEIAYQTPEDHQGCLLRISAFPHYGMYKFNVTNVMLGSNSANMDCSVKETHDPRTGKIVATLTITRTGEGETTADSPQSP